jgi:tRNA pseudouridine38-40 synthase
MSEAVYRLTLAYRGTAYAGWQRQQNATAVQQVVEEALAELLGIPVRVVGASRTDAGVHARAQVAHLKLAAPFPERGLVHGTNRSLPDDVRVLSAERMPIGFDARKSARSKLYSYRLVPCRVLSPLDALLACRVPTPIDLGAMAQAVAHLAGHHDFSAFALAGGTHRDPRRRIFRAGLSQQGPAVVFEVEGDGFLRGMVRALAGTLVEVGLARRTPEGFRDLLAGRPRAAAGPTAPPQGLVLERISYPERWRPLAPGDGEAV